MRQAGQARWQMSIDESQNLAMGLFIRDVIGLTSTHTWLPPAAQTVPPAGGGSPAVGRMVEPSPCRRPVRCLAGGSRLVVEPT